MALRGNLRDFSLPDVFQLVTFSQKTGVLRIVREDGAEGAVWFRDGEVFFASSNWRSDPLGQRLVNGQRITPQALGRALEIRKAEPDDGRRLGQILVDEGYITDKVLESFVSEQIQDTIFDLMRWDDGEFDFEAMPEIAEEDIGLTVSIENVVMEGSRRLEEWSRIKKKIPSTAVVFKMATAPGEGTFEISLKPIEWQLLLLIDGTRSVAELAIETGRTDFEVARIVYGLFSAGLLEFATDEEIARNRAERAEREAKLAKIEAAERQAEQEQQAQALERETLLAKEAERRRDVEHAVPHVVPPQPASEGPVEEPEFLAAATVAPTVEDQAVLDEFMGAVLQAPAVEPAHPPAAAPPAQPHVPAEEPAFFSAGELASETELAGLPTVEELLGMAPVAPAEAEPAGLGEFGTGSDELQIIDGAEHPAVEVVQIPGGFEPTPADETWVAPLVDGTAEPGPLPVTELEPVDFERDLMALGLGELPSELLEPLSAAPEMPPQELQDDPQPVFQDDSAHLEFVEPSAEYEILQLTEPGPPVAEPMSHEWVEELPAEVIEFVPVAPDDLSLDSGVDLAPGAVADVPAAEEAMDFSALIESLDVDADETASLAAASGFDAELLRDEAGALAGGVISTDAYLEDIEIGDLGLSGGLTDELSALTGAKRRLGARPQASVNALPEEGAGMLRRDARLDKDTLLKIIDGIKKL